jgi:hypothetical protein
MKTLQPRLALVALAALAVLAALALAAWRRPVRFPERFDSPPPASQQPSTSAPPASQQPSTSAPPASQQPTAPVASASDYSRTNEGLKAKSLQMNGRTHLYQVPPNPKGTVAMFPGCARPATGFWPVGACPGCLGMPEDVANAKQALRRGYAFIALTPHDTKDFCWSGKVDWPDAGKALERFMSDHGLLNKPLYTMGASAGGKMAVNMQAHAEANRLPFRVSGAISLVATKIDPAIPKKQHPVVYVVMSDAAEKKRAEGNAAALKKAGVPAAVVVATKKQVTPTFFSDRMPVVSATESAQMVAELRKAKLIDSSGTILRNPKDSKGWLTSMSKALSALFKRPGVSANFWKSGVAQALMTAYSKHEAVSEYTTAAFEWFEGGAKTNFAQMAEKYRVAVPASLTI